MSNINQEKLNQQIKSVLDRSVEELDADTRYQLQITRAQVLDDQASTRIWSKWPMFGGVATFASIVALAGFLIVGQPQLQFDEVNDMQLDAVLFEADANIDLYEQYDFYLWLSQQESQG